MKKRDDVTNEAFHEVRNFLRERFNEYKLHMRNDGSFCLGFTPANDNQLRCIFKRDIESLASLSSSGKKLEHILDYILSDWKERLHGYAWGRTYADKARNATELILVNLEVE